MNNKLSEELLMIFKDNWCFWNILMLVTYSNECKNIMCSSASESSGGSSSIAFGTLVWKCLEVPIQLKPEFCIYLSWVVELWWWSVIISLQSFNFVLSSSTTTVIAAGDFKNLKREGVRGVLASPFSPFCNVSCEVFWWAGVVEGLHLVFVYYQSSAGVWPFGGDVTMGNQTVTSEVMKKFHSRYAEIFLFWRAFREGKLFEFSENARKNIY